MPYKRDTNRPVNAKVESSVDRESLSTFTSAFQYVAATVTEVGVAAERFGKLITEGVKETMTTDWIARIKLNDAHRGRWSEFYSIPSGSNPGLTYVVATDEKGEWGCSCNGWIYHTPRRDCKHIRAVKAELQAQATCPVCGDLIDIGGYCINVDCVGYHTHPVTRTVNADDLSEKAQKALTRMGLLETDKAAGPVTPGVEPISGRASRLEL